MQIQKQHTIEDEQEDIEGSVLSASAKALKSSQELEYYDPKGLFAGLRKDYTWMEGM